MTTAPLLVLAVFMLALVVGIWVVGNGLLTLIGLEGAPRGGA